MNIRARWPGVNPTALVLEDGRGVVKLVRGGDEQNVSVLPLEVRDVAGLTDAPSRWEIYGISVPLRF